MLFRSATPLAGCRGPLFAGKAKLTVKRPTDPAKQQIAWKWGAGTATSIADYGDPIHVTSYTLCIYDRGSLVKAIPVPAGGTCGTKPCWSQNAKGFKWKSKAAATLQQLALKPGANGAAQIQAKGKGAGVNPPALPFKLPVRVQLKQDSGAFCWEATYSFPAKNLGDLFSAKAD